MDKTTKDETEKPSTTLPGVVQKIIPSLHPSVPEKVEIEVEGADDLYREIRVDNALTDKDGDKVRLKKGAEVDVTIQADEKDTTKH
jgi:predicted DNA-binding antitoxin AbrB/MazE fold protein